VQLAIKAVIGLVWSFCEAVYCLEISDDQRILARRRDVSERSDKTWNAIIILSFGILDSSKDISRLNYFLSLCSEAG